MSSPRRLSSFSFSRFFARAYLLTTLVRADRKPSSWVPPSIGADAVGEGVDAVGLVAGVPLEGDLDLLARLRPARSSPTLVNSASFVLLTCLTKSMMPPAYLYVDLLRVVLRALVGEADLEALVEERHHLQPLEDRAGRELDGLEDGGVGPERDGGAGAAAGRVADDLQLRLGHAAVVELHPVALAVAVDFDDRAASTARSPPTRRRRAARPTPCSRRHRTSRRRAVSSARSRRRTACAAVLMSTGMPRPLSTTRQAPSAQDRHVDARCRSPPWPRRRSCRRPPRRGGAGRSGRCCRCTSRAVSGPARGPRGPACPRRRRCYFPCHDAPFERVDLLVFGRRLTRTLQAQPRESRWEKVYQRGSDS